MDWNNINIDRDTSGLGPIEYDQSKVPALIRQYADGVRTKTYGQEVREAQARNAEIAGLIASEAVDISNETKGRQDNVETQFNAVQQEMTNKDVISAPEIIVARGGLPQLVDRLDATDARLAQTTQDVNVRGLSAHKISETDNTEEIKTLISEASIGATIWLDSTKTYVVSEEITVNKPLTFKSNGAKIRFSTNYAMENNTLSMFFIQSSDVEFHGLTFEGGDATWGSANNRFIWFTPQSHRGKVINCKFYDLQSGGANFNGAVGYATNTSDGMTSLCYFYNCPGSVFTQGSRTIISDSIASQPKDVSFAINSPSSTGCSVVNCKVFANDISCSIHIGIEEGAKDFIVSNNYIYGVKDGIGIGCVTVAVKGESNGGVISDNIVDGANFTSTKPMAGISIGRNYTNVKVTGNLVKNIGGGHGGNACVTMEVGDELENEFTNNKILNSNATYTIHISGRSGLAKFNITNNIVDANMNNYCIRISGNDLTGVEFVIKDNEFRRANEGISAVSVTTITEMFIENNAFKEVTNPINMPNIFGTFLQENFNVHGRNYIHRLSLLKRKFFYSSSAKSVPTNGYWQTADRIIISNPGPGLYAEKICVQAGTPGTWKGSNLIEQ